MVDTSDVNDIDPFELMDAESERLYTFFSSLTDDEWLPDTRCEGWRRREIVSHLAGGDTYHTACLDDTIAELFAEGARNGTTDGDSFNAWMVSKRADRSAQDVLEEWWKLNSDVRKRMRERGRDASMSSSVGPYPVGLMGFHLASEYATHYDDMDGPITDDEREARTAWRDKVSRFALKEAQKEVEVEERGDEYVVRAGDKEAKLSRAEFVEAVTARLKTIDLELQQALRALA
ncbi:MAG TPA: maleylpyruvate isomerase N-terminal domain-containing protein [Actinomycetota bacterium]|nr:maleylpyruvate isomerase N-terminal domain-containing protein [Actinomycetota bacterium]